MYKTDQILRNEEELKILRTKLKELGYTDIDFDIDLELSILGETNVWTVVINPVKDIPAFYNHKPGKRKVLSSGISIGTRIVLWEIDTESIINQFVFDCNDYFLNSPVTHLKIIDGFIFVVKDNATYFVFSLSLKVLINQYFIMNISALSKNLKRTLMITRSINSNTCYMLGLTNGQQQINHLFWEFDSETNVYKLAQMKKNKKMNEPMVYQYFHEEYGFIGGCFICIHHLELSLKIDYYFYDSYWEHFGTKIVQSITGRPTDINIMEINNNLICEYSPLSDFLGEKTIYDIVLIPQGIMTNRQMR